MLWELVLAHILLPGAVAAAAGFGAWRCWRLLSYAWDPRLQKLMWFYGLFAASLVAMTIWMAQVAAIAGDTLGAGNFSITENLANVHGAFAGAERVDVFLLAHHALMLASLGVAAQAFSQGRSKAPTVAVAAIGLAFLGPFIPAVLAIEATMTLYLAVRAILNRMERRSPGALQVAAGFLLFFVGHLSFFVLYSPGVARSPLGDMFALVGVALLVQLLPRPST